MAASTPPQQQLQQQQELQEQQPPRTPEEGTSNLGSSASASPQNSPKSGRSTRRASSVVSFAETEGSTRSRSRKSKAKAEPSVSSSAGETSPKSATSSSSALVAGRRASSPNLHEAAAEGMEGVTPAADAEQSQALAAEEPEDEAAQQAARAERIERRKSMAAERRASGENLEAPPPAKPPPRHRSSFAFLGTRTGRRSAVAGSPQRRSAVVAMPKGKGAPAESPLPSPGGPSSSGRASRAGSPRPFSTQDRGRRVRFAGGESGRATATAPAAQQGQAKPKAEAAPVPAPPLQPGEAEDEEHLPPPDFSGVLYDCMERRAGRHGVMKLLSSLHLVDDFIFRSARDAILREELLAILMHDIARFFKSQAAKRRWPHVSPHVWRQRAREVVTDKREGACLRAETQNWVMRYKLLHTHVNTKVETVRERRDRLDSFWSQFHEKGRRNELPPVTLQPLSNSSDSWWSSGYSTTTAAMAMTMPVSSGSGSRPNSPPGMRLTRSAANLGARSRDFTADEQWSMIHSIEDRPVDDFVCSRVGMAEPPKWGMKWDPIRAASKWQIINEPLGVKPAAPSRSPAGRGGGPGGARGASGWPTVQLRPGLTNQRLPPLESSGPVGSNSSAYLDQTEDDLPTEKYLEACQRCWVVPMPIPFVTGHSWKLKTSGRDIRDRDLLAMAVMLKDVKCIEEIDLGGNVLLTERALVPFLKRLFHGAAVSTLQRLILRGLKHASIATLDMTVRLLSDSDGLQNLRSLDLCHIRIPMKEHLSLAKAIRAHPTLVEASLSDTGLGGSIVTKTCLQELLSSRTLDVLDISWNFFDAKVFHVMGETLVQTQVLRSLSIASTSASVVGTSSPISTFLEWMSKDKRLTSLDVSLNHMDFRAALIIEDSLELHKQIRRLNISNNVFGVMGVRSCLRLLARASSGLTAIDMEGCFHGSVASEDPTHPPHLLNMTNPGGRYALELKRPYDRSLLRMMYKICARFKLPPEQAFLQLSYSKPPWRHAQLQNGIWEVADTGRLSFYFSMERVLEAEIKVHEDDFTGFLGHYFELMKWKPSFNKVVPLCACWKHLEGHSLEQQVFLNALAKDFKLTVPHVEHLCQVNGAVRNEVVLRLLPTILGDSARRTFFCLMMVSSLGELIRVHRATLNFLDFNVENPSGHYLLHLDSCADHAVALQLLLLDRWEAVLNRRRHRIDTSQRGNASHIRNELYQGRPLFLDFASIADWFLPEHDEFEFDYISSKRPPADAITLDEVTFSDMLVSLFESHSSPEGKIAVLRKVAHHFYLTSLQLRELLGIFKAEALRVEAFVAFFLRIVDICNSKAFRVGFTDERSLRKLQERIGHVTVFPFIQPEKRQFYMDLSAHDQRICTYLLVSLAARENWTNIREFELTRPNGTIEPLPLGVPRSWEKMEAIPKAGFFKATYHCAPEMRQYSWRRHLAEMYGAFNIQQQEADVMWWTGIQEAPEDVLEFLDFVIGNFPDVSVVFRHIDGAEGNGQITLREFEDGIVKLKCKKFKTKDRQQRIASIFRYLDPGGEGTVSQDEWDILRQLWKEYDVTIREFVGFLQRSFGDDLRTAWHHLDKDGNGELDLKEWVEAVESSGFFGNSRIVFKLLDNSDDGFVSPEEFEALNRYKKLPRTSSKSQARAATS